MEQRFVMHLDTRTGHLTFTADEKEPIVIDGVRAPVVAVVTTVHANVEILRGEVVFAEAQQHATLAHAAVANDNQLNQVVV